MAAGPDMYFFPLLVSMLFIALSLFLSISEILTVQSCFVL